MFCSKIKKEADVQKVARRGSIKRRHGLGLKCVLMSLENLVSMSSDIILY